MKLLLLLSLGVLTVSLISCADINDADLIKELDKLTSGGTAPTEDPIKKAYVTGKKITYHCNLEQSVVCPFISILYNNPIFHRTLITIE